jgi:type 1 glutamine amidotransferase
MKKALMITGGWDGHEPVQQATRFSAVLRNEGFEVDVFDNYDVLLDIDKLREYDLFVPFCTCDKLPEGTTGNISTVIGEGMGIAGCHGGMCDAFRDNTEWQFITGGQWVSHPGGIVDYTVDIIPGSSPITEGMPMSIKVTSEKYYVHVDPAIEVLATTRFPVANYYHVSNKSVDMPVMWTKYWGLGRVFYLSLGHQDSVFDEVPEAEELMRRGMLWAAGGKDYAAKHGLTVDPFLTDRKNF